MRDCKSFVLDRGHLTTSDYDWIVDRYRRRFEEIMGNGVEGVQEEAANNAAVLGVSGGGGNLKGKGGGHRDGGSPV